eukprot:815467_1
MAKNRRNCSRCNICRYTWIGLVVLFVLFSAVVNLWPISPTKYLLPGKSISETFPKPHDQRLLKASAYASEWCYFHKNVTPTEKEKVSKFSTLYPVFVQSIGVPLEASAGNPEWALFRIKDFPEIFLVFGGTDETHDIFVGVKMSVVPLENVTGLEDVGVHSGIQSELNKEYDAIVAAVTKYISPGGTLVVTGHSLGGG